MNIELLKYTFNDRIAASKIGAYIKNSGITVKVLPDGTVYVETSMMPAEVICLLSRSMLQHLPSRAFVSVLWRS
ncbi:MAG: hypothetical protein K6C68_05725 [Ruminococcus sp.]|nr:hypothetical protein [Ruminococcus sp.]